MVFSTRRSLTIFAAGLLVASCLPSVASAQLSAIGASKLAIDAPARGTDSAFDPVNGIFLVVGAYGGVYGTFTSSDGSPISGPFALNITPPGAFYFAHYPRVMYSPALNNGAGGFLTRAYRFGEHEAAAAYPGQDLGEHAAQFGASRGGKELSRTGERRIVDIRRDVLLHAVYVPTVVEAVVQEILIRIAHH